MEEKESFLGRGWEFPPSFDLKQRQCAMVSEEEDIRQSLFIIISTIPGERIMDPKFGCELTFSVFDSIDSLALNRIRDYITSSILNYEPRVTLHEITYDTSLASDGVLHIALDYTIRKINIRTNMVYPFYLREGNNIKGI